MRPPTGRSNMLRAALATARFAASIALGRRLAPWSLDWMLSAMLATRAEFGALEERASTASREVAIDEKTRRAIQLRRMRELVRQARHTAYYARELEAAGVDERRAGWSAFDRISVTPKAALRDDPDAFVHREARVVLRTATTGTTGRPTTVCFSAHELLTLSALSAISFLARGDIAASDVVQICSNPRAIGTTTFAAACARLGAIAAVTGAAAPADTLAQLAERRSLPNHKSRVSVLACYPSYLGELIEEAGRRGFGPGDLALERVLTGGEIVTGGLRRRAREVLGDIAIVETYTLTETLPLGGVPCSHGHLHFESSHGLVEVIGVDSGANARAGELGTLVLTPFPRFARQRSCCATTPRISCVRSRRPSAASCTTCRQPPRSSKGGQGRDPHGGRLRLPEADSGGARGARRRAAPGALRGASSGRTAGDRAPGARGDEIDRAAGSRGPRSGRRAGSKPAPGRESPAPPVAAVAAIRPPRARARRRTAGTPVAWIRPPSSQWSAVRRPPSPGHCSSSGACAWTCRRSECSASTMRSQWAFSPQ